MQPPTPLKQIKSLLAAKNPGAALEQTLLLLKDAPRDPALHKLLLKCKTALHKKEQNARKDYFKTGIKRIKTFLKQKEFDKAFRACEELLHENPEHAAAKKLRRKAAIALVETNLHNPMRDQLEAAGDYEKLYLFYQKLHHVFPEYKKLTPLIKETEKKLMHADRLKKADFTKAGLVKLNVLFGEKKYENVIAGCVELLALTHQGSRDAKSLMQKAIQANEKEIERDTYAHIAKNLPGLKATYRAKSEPMIKL